MQSRRRQSYSRQVAVSHLAVPSRLQVASQSYFHQSVTFLYVTDAGDYTTGSRSWLHKWSTFTNAKIDKGGHVNLRKNSCFVSKYMLLTTWISEHQTSEYKEKEEWPGAILTRTFRDICWPMFKRLEAKELYSSSRPTSYEVLNSLTVTEYYLFCVTGLFKTSVLQCI